MGKFTYSVSTKISVVNTKGKHAVYFSSLSVKFHVVSLDMLRHYS